MNVSRWAPASLLALKEYSLATFAHDLSAGITVGLVALPLAMAFAIASGLTPQAGIYCAIITGFLISALGGSRFQIGDEQIAAISGGEREDRSRQPVGQGAIHRGWNE